MVAAESVAATHSYMVGPPGLEPGTVGLKGRSRETGIPDTLRVHSAEISPRCCDLLPRGAPLSAVSTRQPVA